MPNSLIKDIAEAYRSGQKSIPEIAKWKKLTVSQVRFVLGCVNEPKGQGWSEGYGKSAAKR